MHIIKRKRNNNSYYYAIQNARVNGKVKPVKQIYLGTTESIVSRLKENPEIIIKSKTFGSIALLLHIEKQLGLEKIFNNSLDKKRKNNASGKYFLSILFNRILEPASKAGINKWLKTTYLDWIWNVNISSQTFWNHLDYLDDEAIAKIESKIAEKIFEKTDDKEFLLDTTNHFTYIQKRNSKVLAKGKSKQGRSDKNLLCYGLLVGRDSRMPVNLFQYKYEHDSEFFKEKIDGIIKFLELYRKCGFTLIFDKGNNSKDNIEKFIEHKFIGSLRKEQATKLLEIPLEKYASSYITQKEHTVYIFDAGKKSLYGSEYRVVLSYQKESYDKQKKRFEETIAKALEKYEKIKGKKYEDAVSASNDLNTILPKKYKKAFKKEILREGDEYILRLSEVPKSKALYETHFGKNVLFTNMLETPAIEIVQSYRSLHVVEDQFKALHNAFLVPITPVYEWTDQKIKAHIFLCYLALILVRMLEYMARKKEMHITFSKLLKEAKNIRVGLVSDGKKAKYCFERMDMEQQKIMSAFDLHEFFHFQ